MECRVSGFLRKRSKNKARLHLRWVRYAHLAPLPETFNLGKNLFPLSPEPNRLRIPRIVMGIIKLAD